MPIDVASGAVHFDKRDIQEIPGRFPLTWERSYHSGLSRESDSPFGPGWTNPFFVALTRNGKDYHFRNSGGAIIVFPDPGDSVEREGTIRNLGSFHEIARKGMQLRVTSWSGNGKVVRYHFQPQRNGQWWPLRSIEDAAGNGLELAWDDQGRLKGLRQIHEKRTLAIAYSEAGRITAVGFRHADGRQQLLARYGYDDKGRMVSAQDALGNTERYEYLATGQISREIAGDGGILSYKYDDSGRCIRMSGIDNYNLKIIRYLDHVRWTEVTNSLGKTTRYQWLASGQVVLQMNPMGGKTETKYDDLGRIAAKTSPMGERTVFGYDEQGNKSKLVDASGGESVFEYNESHLAVKFSDPNGGGWEKVFDASNRPVSAKDAVGNISSIAYDESGNPVLLKKADGAVSKRIFSGSGDLIEVSDWESKRTRFERDEFGRIAKRLNPDGSAVAYLYDLLGRLAQVAYSHGKTVEYQYDAGGNLVSVASNMEAPVSLRYGPCRRLQEKRFGGGNVLKYTWGSEPERLETVTNQAGEIYSFQYDACDRVNAETGFDGRKTSFKFDLSGRCVSRINAIGQSVNWEHDPLGRIVKESLGEEEPTVFAYDKAGNLLSAENAWSAIALQRDAAGRVLKETQNGFSIAREYNPTGDVARLETDADIHFEYAYDGNGLIRSLDANGLGSFTYARNERNLTASIGLPGDARLLQTHDSRGRLLKQDVFAGEAAAGSSAPLIERAYAFDDTSMLVAMDEASWGKSRYVHDESKRLVQFTAGEFRLDYALNPVGDPTALVKNGMEETSFRYLAGGTLTGQGVIRYEYDGAGRLVSKSGGMNSGNEGRWTYSWDAKDRLRKMQTPDGETWEYAYDPFGRRCLKKCEDREIRFIWNQNVLLHEIEKDRGTKTWGFEPGGFRPLFKIQDGALFSIILDEQGTPREMLDGKSKVVWSARFDPWGNPLDGKGDLQDCPFRFQGQYFDAESGLHYNRFRYYDPQSGRFISRDPILLDGGPSSYQYVHNPTRGTDPLGLCEDETLYRAMSQDDYDELVRTGRMPATTETTTSPTRAFSEDYDGVLVEFKLQPGTIAELAAIGVSDGSKMVRKKYPDMPVGESGWNQEHARFKKEGKQINIALGQGDALDIFNDNITDFNAVRP